MMNWTDSKSFIKIYPPKAFNFKECLVFLGRDSQEILHQIHDEYLYKLISIDDQLILFKVMNEDDLLKVEFLNTCPNKKARNTVAKYIWHWFDLDTNLDELYEFAKQDEMLHDLTIKYKGFRMIGINDLFETIVWAILGQQINLSFAYTLKKRFVEQFGQSLTFKDNTFWLFPSFDKIANLKIDDLRTLQITNRKSEYILGVANAMQNEELSKKSLIKIGEYDEVKRILMRYRGIGPWSADYIMMKCLHFTNAFPISDVGLHNALKNSLNISRKPTIKELEVLSKRWEGWQAYATFYLWRSLYDI